MLNHKKRHQKTKMPPKEGRLEHPQMWVPKSTPRCGSGPKYRLDVPPPPTPPLEHRKKTGGGWGEEKGGGWGGKGRGSREVSFNCLWGVALHRAVGVRSTSERSRMTCKASVCSRSSTLGICRHQQRRRIT